jgi:hypothetical protein
VGDGRLRIARPSAHENDVPKNGATLLPENSLVMFLTQSNERFDKLPR